MAELGLVILISGLALIFYGIAARSVQPALNEQITSRVIFDDMDVALSWIWRGPYDELIYREASARQVPANLIKAIAQHESSMNPGRVNPETSVVREAVLRNEILAASDGGDSVIRRHEIDPSIGLMQIRVSTARDFESIQPVDLFNASTNVRIGAKFVRWLFDRGVTPDTIDAYNVGLGNLNRGVRNSAYRSSVLALAERYMGDFPA